MWSSTVTKVSKKRQVRRAMRRRLRAPEAESGLWAAAAGCRLTHRATTGDSSQRMTNGAAIGQEFGLTHTTYIAAAAASATPPAICRKNPARLSGGPTFAWAAVTHSSRFRRDTRRRNSVRRIASDIAQVWSAKNTTKSTICDSARLKSEPTARRWIRWESPSRRGTIPVRNGKRAGSPTAITMKALHRPAEAGGNVHPPTRARKLTGADTDRRKLSIIFQRPTSGIARRRFSSFEAQ